MASNLNLVASRARDVEEGSRSQLGLAPTTAPAKHSSVPHLPSKDQSREGDDGLAWNPQHPCFPHPNCHVPLSSPLFPTTRLIRVPRDWLIAGDLAPTFSNTYPEILEPWVSEQDFRELVQGVNQRLTQAFSPFTRRVWLDSLLGFLTGWLWDDFGMTGIKRDCAQVEAFIERWNASRGTLKTSEKATDEHLVKCAPLRRTGYLSLDIQIPDPHVGLEDAVLGAEQTVKPTSDGHPFDTDRGI